MRPTRTFLVAVFLVAAATCLAGELLGQALLIYVAKPAATMAVLLIALTAHAPVSASYQRLIVAGLLCSLAGDVFLMLPGDRFVPGLASFLVAHLFYIAAFAGAGGGFHSPLPALGVSAVGALMLVIIGPGLGPVRLPVALYVCAIVAMSWQALARWRRRRAPGTAFAAAGALLFMVSDGSLAVRRFVGDFPGSVILVLVTYWAAQYLIARSVASGASA